MPLRPVVMIGSDWGRVKATGREWTTRLVHVITVREGKITQLDSYFDTAAFLDAYRG